VPAVATPIRLGSAPAGGSEPGHFPQGQFRRRSPPHSRPLSREGVGFRDSEICGAIPGNALPSPRPSPRGRGGLFWGGLYTSAQDLERIFNFWKTLSVNPSGRGHFSPIAIHRMIFARHNRERETHVAEYESESSSDPPRTFLPLVPDFPPARAAPGSQMRFPARVPRPGPWTKTAYPQISQIDADLGQCGIQSVKI
jgi:hypothetical protein